MGCSSRGELLEEIERFDPATADVAGARRVLGAVAQLEGYLGSVKVAASRTLRERHSNDGGPRSEIVIGGILGKAEAGRVQQRAATLEQVPAIEVALRSGAITPTHVDALVGPVKQNPALADLQIEIAQAAADMSPDRFRQYVRRLAYLCAEDGGVSIFERQRRDTRLRTWVDGEGMYCFHGRFDPERGSQIQAALFADVERQFHAGEDPTLEHDQRLAIALHHRCTRRRAGDRMQVSMPVHVDLATLMHGLHERSHIDIDGGGMLPVATLRRLACDAQVLPIVLDGDGVAVEAGRSRRFATTDQRRMLRAMYETCGVPGCTVPYQACEAHHIHWWERFGPTDLANLIPLCSRHHHDVHEGGWTLSMDAQRNVTWTGPPTRAVLA